MGPEEPAPGDLEPLQRRVFPGESIRVFPLSNWTELDIWTYIETESIEIPELYLAAEREVVERGGMLYAVNEFIPLIDG